MTEKFQFSNSFLQEETQEENDNIIFPLVMVLAVSVFIGFFGYLIYQNYHFTKECQGNLERLKYATTIEVAQKYLKLTMPQCQQFAIQNKWNFWYDNLQAQQLILNSTKSETSTFEKQQALERFKTAIKQEKEWRESRDFSE
jgi:hypothetical protein